MSFDWSTAGAQANAPQRQQRTDITDSIDAIESRIHALEFLARRPHETASSSSTTLNTFDNNYTCNASLSANVSCCGAVEGVATGSRHQHGRPSLEFAIDTDGHNGTEYIIGQLDDQHTFDDMFDFDRASYAADANNRPDTWYDEDADAHDFGAMSVGTPFDTASSLPVAVTTGSDAMSATPMAAVSLAAPPRSRYQCLNCGKTFLRPSDRDRHALKHNPNAQRYPCTYLGCRYSGMRAFLRKDKLREHRARYGH